MNQRRNLIVIDDDKEMRALVEDYFVSTGCRVSSFENGAKAFEAIKEGGRLHNLIQGEEVDAVVSDINMPEMNGLEFARRMKEEHPEIPVLLITAFGTIDTAIEAMKNGAFDYVVKPFKLAELTVNIQKAFEYRDLKRDNQYLRREVKKQWMFGTGTEIIGKSAAMQAVFDLVRRISHSGANVLITGESGTGKDLVARAIHASGPRAKEPFVAINCSAIPETLLESELFGHAKGSFTGAISRKKGLIEEADGGTLFLDEIGDMNVHVQAKLLRVIQDKKVRLVGENTSKDVDVRIIAATHKDLKAGVKAGWFREDLFYRLSVIPIVIPPLRNRTDDIPVLAEHFLRKHSATNNQKVKGFTKKAMARLIGLHWEGNVRELENVIERAVVLSTDSLIDADLIPEESRENFETFFENMTQSLPSLTDIEKRYMKLVLEKTQGRKDRTAEILGINRRTLYRKEREYGFVAANAPVENESSAKYSFSVADPVGSESSRPGLS